MRTWTIFDWCEGELREHSQTIKVSDFEGPSIAGLEDVTISTDVWQCSATYYVPEPFIMDNCSNISGEYTVGASSGVVEYLPNLGRYVVSGLIPFSTHTISVRTEDCCGNTNTVDFEVSVEDLVPPTAVCETYFQSGLTIDGTTKIFATTFDEGSHDACGAVWFKTRRMDGSTFEDFATYSCSDIGNNVMTVFRVFDINPGSGPVNSNRMDPGGDLHGHYNDCMVEVEIQDKLPPTISCPSDLTIDCSFWFDREGIEDLQNTTFGTVRTNFADVEYININGVNVGSDGLASDNCISAP